MEWEAVKAAETAVVTVVVAMAGEATAVALVVVMVAAMGAEVMAVAETVEAMVVEATAAVAMAGARVGAVMVGVVMVVEVTVAAMAECLISRPRSSAHRDAHMSHGTHRCDSCCREPLGAARLADHWRIRPMPRSADRRGRTQ